MEVRLVCTNANVTANILAVMMALVPFCGTALAQDASYIDSCAKSLTINQISGFSDETVQLAILTYLTTSSSSEQDFSSKFAGFVSSGFFDGTLSDAQRKRSSLEKGLNLNFTRQQAQGYLGRYLSPDGASAFSDCVGKVFSSPGLHLALENADESTAGVIANYTPAKGETRSFMVKVFTDGSVPEGMNLSIPPGGVIRSFTITRLNPSKDLHIQVDAEADGTVTASQQLFIPPFYKTDRTESREAKKTGEVRAECGSYRDSNHYTGNTDSIYPDAGYQFETSSTAPKITRFEGEKGKVPGAGSAVQILKNEATIVTAGAICYPGSSTDEHYWIAGYVTSNELKVSYKLSLPPDNGVKPTMRMVTR